jgi:undecaprenyl-diphosphatase
VRIQNGPTTGVADTLSFVGGAWVTWTLRVLACGVLAIRRHWLSLSAFALAVASSEVLIGTLKAAYDRHRPPGGLIATHGASFPSGHAVAAAVTAIGIVLALLPPGRARRRWVACAVGFVVAMALSRVYLRAHWLSDAAAGALLGAGLALGWPALLQTVRGMHQPAQATADPKRPCKIASS